MYVLASQIDYTQLSFSNGNAIKIYVIKKNTSGFDTCRFQDVFANSTQLSHRLRDL